MSYHTQLPLDFFSCPFTSLLFHFFSFHLFFALIPFLKGYVFGYKVQILDWKSVCNVGLMGGFLLPPASVVGRENGQHFLLR